MKHFAKNGIFVTEKKSGGDFMISIPAYFDGIAVRPIENFNFNVNQKLAIVIIENTESDKSKTIQSLRGSLSQYANPNLIQHEKEAWEMAVQEKYLEQ